MRNENLELPKLDTRTLAEAIGGLERWAKQCHGASIALLRSGLLPKEARVARGLARGVISQHSWVALGNPYDITSPIVDATIWSYQGDPPHILVTQSFDDYIPKGAGNIFAHGKEPPARTGKLIELQAKLSISAERFLKKRFPEGLDVYCWNHLGNSPVGGWPSKEIITAMWEDKRLKAFIPIDVVGMLLDVNPGELYR